MSLFLEGFLGKEGTMFPSKVRLEFTSFSSAGTQSANLEGILTGEPTINGQNKWGPVLQELSNLTDVGSLISSTQLTSWIGASNQCWKSTDPIKVNLDMMLINYKKSLNIEDKLKSLMKLTSLHQGDGSNVMVHGGYVAEPLATNKDWFDNNVGSSFTGSSSDDTKTWSQKLAGFVLGLEGNSTSGLGTGTLSGTVTVYIGDRVKLTNMLVSGINCTPSNVHVFDGLKGGVPKGRPLYYQVSVSLLGARPLLDTDVDNMF